MFNGAVLAMYGILLYLFPIKAVADEMLGAGKGYLALLMAMGNLAFLLFDKALLPIAHVYVLRFRPLVARFL